MSAIPETMRRLVSEAKNNGTLEVRLEEVPTPKPGPGEVLIKVEATPINPSDLAVLLGITDPSQASVSGSADLPVVSLPIPDFAMPMMQGRMNQVIELGNEGSGTVVAAGSDEGAGLVGKRVAAAGGSMYAEYISVPMPMVMPLMDGTSARDGASAFVNPMTALSMTKVMKRDGSPALVHTAAASNLGQMLQRICKADGIPLINVVRKPEQQAILKDLGAEYTLNSTDSDFVMQMAAAAEATGATVGFDAVGGGDLAGRIITGMEIAQQKKMTEYSRYGSSVHKQVYVYGRLDLSAVSVPPSVGMAWGVGGFLLTNFLATISQEERMGMAGRVISELTTTFASHYTDEITMAEALNPDVMVKYNAKATGTKFLITPSA